ncbi:hypothetical protein X777_07052, partial [Ooceraea biroi]
LPSTSRPNSDCRSAESAATPTPAFANLRVRSRNFRPVNHREARKLGFLPHTVELIDRHTRRRRTISPRRSTACLSPNSADEREKGESTAVVENSIKFHPEIGVASRSETSRPPAQSAAHSFVHSYIRACLARVT